MAPIKFENNMKETLEKRSLKPSDQAWDKLSHRLDIEKRNNNKNTYRWLGIAASVVLFISAGLFFLNSDDRSNTIPVIVKSEDENRVNNGQKTEDKTFQIKADDLVQSQENGEQVVDNNMVEKEPKINLKAETSPSDSKQKDVLGEEILIHNKANNAVAETARKEPIIEVTFEEKKLNEVIAEIQKRQSDNASVSDREIDSLLKAAQREIMTNRIKLNNSSTVDANELLREVEADIDASFRDRVFDALKNGYRSVKSAVAERNQK